MHNVDVYTRCGQHIGADFDRVVFSRFNLKIRAFFGESVISKKQEQLLKNLAVIFVILSAHKFHITTCNDSLTIANKLEVCVNISSDHFARF